MIRVKIPATSANLGAGIDCLGLALNLYNYVDMVQSDTIEIVAADRSFVPQGKKNLVYSTVEYLFNEAGKTLKGLKLIQQSNIPMTRGLGSSSACIVGGLMGANIMLGEIFSKDDLVNIAAKIEGHPDNTTPALLGGIVTSAIDGEKVYYAKQCIGNELMMVAIIPNFRMKTATARECLPTEISHLDARFNISRAALLTASLQQGKYENIRVAVEDKLHQPYRLGLIENGSKVMSALYDFGAYGVYLSGSGPTIMAIVPKENDSFISKTRVFLNQYELSDWAIKKLSVDNIGATAKKQ